MIDAVFAHRFPKVDGIDAFLFQHGNKAVDIVISVIFDSGRKFRVIFTGCIGRGGIDKSGSPFRKVRIQCGNVIRAGV